MRKLFLILAYAFLLSANAFATTGTLYGYIQGSTNNEPNLHVTITGGGPLSVYPAWQHRTSFTVPVTNGYFSTPLNPGTYTATTDDKFHSVLPFTMPNDGASHNILDLVPPNSVQAFIASPYSLGINGTNLTVVTSQQNFWTSNVDDIITALTGAGFSGGSNGGGLSPQSSFTLLANNTGGTALPTAVGYGVITNPVSSKVDLASNSISAVILANGVAATNTALAQSNSLVTQIAAAGLAATNATAAATNAINATSLYGVIPQSALPPGVLSNNAASPASVTNFSIFAGSTSNVFGNLGFTNTSTNGQSSGTKLVTNSLTGAGIATTGTFTGNGLNISNVQNAYNATNLNNALVQTGNGLTVEDVDGSSMGITGGGITIIYNPASGVPPFALNNHTADQAYAEIDPLGNIWGLTVAGNSGNFTNGVKAENWPAGNATGIATINASGQIQSNAPISADTSGQVLESTGVGVAWATVSGGTALQFPTNNLDTALTNQEAGAVSLKSSLSVANGAFTIGGTGNFSGNGFSETAGQLQISGSANISGVLTNTNAFLVSPKMTNGVSTNFIVYSDGVAALPFQVFLPGLGDALTVDLAGDVNVATGTLFAQDGFNSYASSGDIADFKGGSSHLTEVSISQSGTVTASNFVGNGAGLTNLQSTNIVGPYFTNIQVEADLLTTNLTQWVDVAAQHGHTGIFSIASNVLAIAGQNGGGSADAYGDCLENTNFGDPFHWSTMSFTLRILQTNANCGLGFGYYSQGQVDSNCLFFLFNITPSGGYNGEFSICYGGQSLANQPNNNAFNQSPIFGNSSPPTNTPFGITLVRRGQQFFLTFSNQLTGATWGISTSMQSINGGTFSDPSGWAFPAFWANNNVCANISNFKYTIDTFYPVQVLLVGDSITSGFGAGNPEDLWSHRLMRAYQYGVDVDAGGGATSQDMTNWVAAKYLRPSNIVDTIGVNDWAFSIAKTAIEANITNFAGINSNYTIHYYQAAPVPWQNWGSNPGTNLSWLANFVVTNYLPANVVDFYDSLLDSVNPSMQTNFSYDGVHPNANGQGIMFDIVNNKLNGKLGVP